MQLRIAYLPSDCLGKQLKQLQTVWRRSVQQAARNFKILRTAAAAAAAALLLALSTALGRGTAPASRQALLLLAGAALCAVAWRKASDFVEEFYYVPYVHQDRP